MSNDTTQAPVALMTTTDARQQMLTRRERPELVFSAEQRAMIRNSFASGASEEEFAVLLEVCRAKRLNPLLGQVHLVKRWNQARGCETWATQTSIDGFRSIAEDTGLYDGQDEPEFGYDPSTGKLLWAKVRVYRKDVSRPFVGVAHFAEYAQTKRDGSFTTMWQTKPHIMCAKCSESLALRKAFPQELGDIYTADEMEHETPSDRLQSQVNHGVSAMQSAPREESKPREDYAASITAAKSKKDLDDIAARANADESLKGAARKATLALWTTRWDELLAAAKAEMEAKKQSAPPKTTCEECSLLGMHADTCSKYERQPGDDDT